jgi:phosphoribosyl 1,2-cyclic phosphodiesterase
MRIRFWGTRGSIPKPGPDTIRYGGNTSCVEVRSASGVLILLDCGTGAHAFGQALLAEEGGPRRGHIFISHTHWDHIQGLPFLAPLFDPSFEWDVYGPRGLGPSIRETLAGQMQYTYFPVTIEQFAAKVHYHDLGEGSVDIDDVRVTAHYMNHPALTLGYRIEADGASMVYATDHEPHSPALARGDLAAQPRRVPLRVVRRRRGPADPRRAVHARGVREEAPRLGAQPGRVRGRPRRRRWCAAPRALPPRSAARRSGRRRDRRPGAAARRRQWRRGVRRGRGTGDRARGRRPPARAAGDHAGAPAAIASRADRPDRAGSRPTPIPHAC